MRLIFICFVITCFLTFQTTFAQTQSTDSIAKLGSAAPSFTVTTMTGTTYKLEDLKGKVVVLNFWSTKCVTCAAETKDLNALVDAYKGKEVVFLGIAHNAQPSIEKFVKKHPFKYEIIPAGLQQVITTYGVPIGNGFYDIPFPMHILINQQGTIEVNEIGIKGVSAIRRKLAEIFKDNAAKTE